MTEKVLRAIPVEQWKPVFGIHKTDKGYLLYQGLGQWRVWNNLLDEWHPVDEKPTEISVEQEVIILSPQEHKEQICKAYNAGWSDVTFVYPESAEKFYTDTYYSETYPNVKSEGVKDMGNANNDEL